MKKNICRPIVLYNVHVPAKKISYTWKYCTFGIFDGIDIGDNIWKNDTKSFLVLMESLAQETAKLKGNFSMEVKFAIRTEDMVENKDKLFWDESSYPFVFLVSLYMYGRAENWTKLCRHIETSINQCEYNSEVKAICYQTLDNSDILLVIKSKSYKKGTDLINLFHNEKTKIVYQYDTKKFEEITLHYSYSVCGFDRAVDMEAPYINEVIDKVSFLAFEKKPGSIEGLYEKLNEIKIANSGMILKKVNLLGSNDVEIVIENITWGVFMKLFRSDAPVLTSEAKVYCDSICYGSTLLNHDASMALSKDILKKSVSGKAVKGIIKNGTNLLQDYIDEEDGIEDLSNVRELEYMKALAHIQNAMHKFEDSEFPSYVYTAILQPMQLFLKQLRDFKNGKIENVENCTDNGIFNFLNGVNLVMQSTSRMNRDFLQTPDFNLVINDVPIKLFAFYAAWTHKVTKILNTNNEESDGGSSETKNKKAYSVLICPGLEKFVEVDMIFPKFPPGDRLLVVKTPERALYNPEMFCNILVHEISHYVGSRIRKRKTRYDSILNIYSSIIAEKFLEFLGEEASNVINKKRIYSLLQKRATDYIEVARQKNPEFQKYQYYTDFFKHTSDKIIMSLIHTDLSKLYKEVEESRIKVKLYKDNTFANKFFIEEFEDVYKKKKEIESKQQDLIDFFEKNHRLITNNVNNIAKETYADLICILLLEIPGEAYLKTLYNSLRELADTSLDITNNIVSIRVALLILCMQYVKIKNRKKFKFFWDQKLLCEVYNQNYLDDEFCIWIRNIDNLIIAVYSDEFQKGNKEYLLYKEVWESLKKYLLICRIEFEDWEQDNLLKSEINNLRNVYKNVSNVEDIEQTILAIRKLIDEHKQDLSAGGC